MQLQWEERQPSACNKGAEKRLTALLVNELHPTPSGKSRIIAELASIEIRFLTVNVQCTREFHQGLFWSKVDKHLASITISPTDKSRIEAQIATKVPRPGCEWALWGVTCIPRYDP